MTKTRTNRILVVDDDRQLQENLCEFLSSNGFETISLFSGQGVIETILNERPCAVLLDVMLPDGANGFEIIRQIRSRSDLPVLMLTARGKEIDMVVGLESGADDYLSKPFRMLELLARIRAVLRRTRRGKPGTDTNPDIMELDGFILDSKAHSLKYRQRTVELSATEVKALRALMGNPGDVLQRDVLLTLVFGRDYHSTNRNVDVHISHLRAHLRQIAPELSPIRTVWGAGYRWRLKS